MSTTCSFADLFLTNVFDGVDLGTILLWTLAGLAILALVATLVLFFVYRRTKNGRVFSSMRICAYVAILAAFSAAVFFINSTESEYADLWTYLALFVAAALFVLVVRLTARKTHSASTRELTFAATCIALSFALSYVKLFPMPQGGSVTLASTLPLAVYCFYFGFKKGLLSTFIYSLLQMMQDPWLFNPWQILLDYTVAFSVIAVVGLFSRTRAKLGKWGLLIGLVIYAVVRYACHVTSGAIFFAEYAGTQNPWIYSLGYNSFVFVDLAISVAVGMLLFSSRAFVRYLDRFVASLTPAPVVAVDSPVVPVADTEQADTPDGSTH